MIRILMNGYKGRMGQAIMSAAEKDADVEIAAKVDTGDDPAAVIDDVDAVIDFSFHSVTPDLARLCAQHKRPLIVGTTGHRKEEGQAIRRAAESIPVVWAGNYSVGVNTLFYLTQKAAEILSEGYDAEISEIHHRHKKDAPSGTAAQLIAEIQKAVAPRDRSVVHGREGITGERPDDEIGVHSLRGGEVVGEHTVYFFGEHDRIELKHQATDRRIFAEGAIRAAKWAAGRSAGLYNMRDVLGLAD